MYGYVSHGRFSERRAIGAKCFFGAYLCQIAPYFGCSNRIKTKEQYTLMDEADLIKTYIINKLKKMCQTNLLLKNC